MQDFFDKAWHVGLCQSGLRYGCNRLRFGKTAPYPNQAVCLAAADIVDRYSPKSNAGQMIGSRRTGQVLEGAWDQHRTTFVATRKFKACRARFRDGASWEESGIIAYSLRRIAKSGPFDDCTTQDDVIARYAALDALWQVVKEQGQLPPAPRHARDGILVHVDRDGRPLFGNQGFHRLAIAKLAGLEQITVSLGLVHQDALRSGAFQRLLK